MPYPSRIATGDARLQADSVLFVQEALADIGIRVTDEDFVRLGVCNDILSIADDTDVRAVPSFLRLKERIYETMVMFGKQVHTLVPRSAGETEMVTKAALEEFPNYALDLCDPRPVLLFAPSNITGVLNPGKLQELLDQIKNISMQQSYRLVLVTAPRTGAGTELITKSSLLDSINRSYLWRGCDNSAFNPYLYYLKQADVVVTTGDSLSMMSDAVNAGKKTLIIHADKATGLKGRLIRQLYKRKFAQRFAPDIDLRKLKPADSEKTGWPEVRRAVCYAALRKINERKLTLPAPLSLDAIKL